MNHTRLFAILAGMACLSLLASCAPFRSLGTMRLAPYQKSLTVQYRILHQGDSTRLWLQTDAPVFQVAIKAYAESDGRELLFEQTWYGNNAAQPNSYTLPVQLHQYVLVLSVRSLANNALYRDTRYVNKSGISMQTLPILLPNDTPLVVPYITQPQVVRIMPHDTRIQQLRVRYYPDPQSPVLPPYASQSSLFNPQATPHKTFLVPARVGLQITQPGLYYIQADTQSTQGIFLSYFDQPEYPKLTQLHDLVESTRYITKDVEYETLRRAPQQKVALDEFWLTLGVTQTRSKDLLRTYYHRVQVANAQFTTHKEGWKTDRGIIFIVFGEPDRVLKKGNREYWSYDPTVDHAPVEFFFELQAGQYLLSRSSYYEPYWKAHIYDWRKGRIYDRAVMPLTDLK